MSGLQISIPALDAITRGYREAPDLTQREMLVAMTEATLLLQREAVEAMPRGATGLTRQSITSDAWSVPAGVLGVVGSTQPSALYVELGTKPHMPPIAPLVPWVRQVLGVAADRAERVAYLVARKIARKGTAAQKPFERTAQANAGQVVAMFENAAARIAAHLAAPGGAGGAA